MSSSFDISRFPNLPPEVLKAFEAQQAALEASRMEASVERAARLHQEAVLSEKESLIATLKELIEKLEGQVEQYRRAKFGPKSEKLDPDQLQRKRRLRPIGYPSSAATAEERVSF